MCNPTAEPNPHVKGVLYRPLSEREALLFRQVLRDYRIGREDRVVSLGGHTLFGNILWVQGGLN